MTPHEMRQHAARMRDHADLMILIGQTDEAMMMYQHADQWDADARIAEKMEAARETDRA